MPYITHEERERFTPALASLAAAMDEDDVTAGQVNYLLCIVAKLYVDKKGARYATFNDVMGAFEGASAEFYRRVVAPYEDGKIRANGDVFAGDRIGDFEKGMTHVANPQPHDPRGSS